MFTSTANACQDAEDNAARPGDVAIALYGLELTEGTWTTSEIEYAVFGATCSEDDDDQFSSTAMDYTVTIDDALADPVVGTIALTFEDGSTFAGTFAAPRCDSTVGGSPTCE